MAEQQQLLSQQELSDIVGILHGSGFKITPMCNTKGVASCAIAIDPQSSCWSGLAMPQILGIGTIYGHMGHKGQNVEFPGLKYLMVYERSEPLAPFYKVIDEAVTCALSYIGCR